MNFSVSKPKKDARRLYCDVCKTTVFGTIVDMRHHKATPMHKRNEERALEEQHKQSRIDKIRRGAIDPTRPEATLNFQKSQREQKNEENKLRMKEMLKKNAEKDHVKKKLSNSNSLIGKSVSLKDRLADRLGKGSVKARASKVWDIIIDRESGKVVFFNSLTGEKSKDKPTGLILDEEDQELWDRSQMQVFLVIKTRT